MLKAIICDFNGVIVDDEPLHMRTFQRVLAEEGIPLSPEEYHTTYLAMDDRGAFSDLLHKHNRPLSPALLADLIRRKSVLYNTLITEECRLFPGAVDFVRKAASRYTLAIASGALRPEIEAILERAGIRECFEVIVSAEDVARGKPDPECFRTALARLNAEAPRGSSTIRPAECVVIEDSRAGVEAAHAAEMLCLAVTNSYSASELHAADMVVSSLEGLDPARLEALGERRR